ncbi:MAG TPA: hypothetical protein VF748_14715 [Candidatus Acidoferrum sp.]
MSLPARPDLNSSLQEGLRRPMPPHISLKGNRFTLVDAAGRTAPVDTFDPKTGPYLDCVICDVNEKVSRIYYEGSYDPDNPGPPDCFSDNGVAPSANAQSPQAVRCDICPQAEWGSATSNLTGKGIPACRSYKKLAVLIEAFPSMVFMLAIPPASLNALGDYAKVCSGYKVQVTDVLTRISFMPDKMGILVFDPKDHASEEMKERVNKVWATPEGAGAIIGRFDKPRTLAIEHQAPMTQETVRQHIEKSPSQAPSVPQSPFGSTAPASAGFGTAEGEGASPFATTNSKEKKAPGRPRGSGKPKTLVEAPKNSLQGNGQNPSPFGQSAAAQQTQTTSEQGKFGVVEQPPEADPGMGKALDNLFGTKFE